MKKSSIYSIALGSTLLISTIATIAVGSAIDNTNPIQENQAIISLEPNLSTIDMNNNLTNDESVYIITDYTGAKTKTFINNTLETINNSLPIELKISYYLNNEEISAKDLAGKSGHIKIKYEYFPTKTYQDKYVPFLTITGLTLDQNKFKNLKLENGKIISKNNNLVIAGYSMVGLNENLHTDFLPSSFSLEADVTNFSIETTYTIATNELFADLDISKLNSIDEITSQINQLSSSLDQIISGSLDLSNGLDAAFMGAKKLQVGANELTTGISILANNLTSLNSGANKLVIGAEQLSNGLNSVVDVNNQILAKISPITTAIDSQIVAINNTIAEISTENPELAARLAQVVNQLSGYYNQAHTAVIEYTDGIETLAGGANELKNNIQALANGTSELKNGANALLNGSNQLKSGTDTLAEGLDQLSTGSRTLYSGLNAFKQQGIDKLVNFANQDLQNFSYNLKKSIDAAKSYHNYSNKNAKSVKFIFKTPSIK